MPRPYICWNFQRSAIGLVGKNSRLFFILLGTIRAMQELVQVRNVRYLVENAGSMIDLHYQAFCDLLGLTSQQKHRFLWDPADHGFGITRKRNFFVNMRIVKKSTCPKGPALTKGGPSFPRKGNRSPCLPY